MSRPGSVVPEPVMLPAADGTPLALHDLGGSGEPALFAHAAGFHGQIWGPVSARLASRLRMWAVDLRGHGDSGPCESPRDYSGFGDDVLAAAGSIGRPVLGIGHSLGGAAMLMAELAAPGTFTELVLYEPAVSDPDLLEPQLQPLFAGIARRRRTTFPNRTEAFQNFSTKPPTNVLAEEVLVSYTTHGFRRTAGDAVEIKCDPATEAAIYEADGPRHLWQQMAPMSCAITLIRGAESEIWDVPTATGVADRIGATLREQAGAGHFGPLQHPAAFAAVVREILA